MVAALLMVLDNGLCLLDAGGVSIADTCSEEARNLEVEVVSNGHM